MRLTAVRVRELLDYNAETGVFTWRVNKGVNAPAGRVAGNVAVNGYIRIGVDRAMYLAHRLAWLYMHGEFPPGQVDHINGDRADNRGCNLRLATNAQNTRNAKIPRTNTSGVKGVSWSKVCGKWFAYVKANGRRRNLGHFTDIADAAEAVRIARIEMHGEFAKHAVKAS